MAKLKISLDFRLVLAEKIMDLGNLTIAALALGQLLSGKEFSAVIFSTGILLMVLCYIVSFTVSQK